MTSPDRLEDTFDVAIIGGGLIGSAAAFELAGRNLRVVVLDRQQPGRESSWAAAGMLAPGPDSPDSHGSTKLVPLAKESLRLYPEFVAAIEEGSGKPTSFAREGTLEIFHGASSEAARDHFVAEHRRLGLSAEPIRLESARGMEPSLNTEAGAAAWLPDEATIDPRALMDAVLSAAANRGAQIRADCATTSLLMEGGRCAGVVAGGHRISAGHVVITAGCFSSAMEDGIARHAPTRPVRGQMISLRHRDVKLTRVLRSANGYLVPRPDGRILAGSTLEDAGFAKSVTPAGLQKILSAALELAPALGSAEILETWAGLRPGTPDDLPILGPSDTEGLIVATGHYRNGVLLAPITAKLVREWITEGKVSADAEAFSPLRFQNREARSSAAQINSARP
ncbi:MAG TPA: glycine oxidase ThiO [Candidatus Acidoferrales bacterium]|nr:glycine oxidase ThiO [Candidatus Acidoferrales bacterium]